MLDTILIEFSCASIFSLNFLFSENKKMPADKEAVIIVVAGGGSVAVLIGLYKLDALGKLGKYLHTKNFDFEH